MKDKDARKIDRNQKVAEFFKVCLWLLLITFIFGWLMNTQAHADSIQLDQLATEMAGKPVTVECFPADGLYGGYIMVNDGVMETTIHLAGDRCGALQNVLTPGPRTARWVRSFEASETIGLAMMDLTHEAIHERLNSTDEGLVECTAVRNVWNTIKLLPLPWKVRHHVYGGAVRAHLAMPTTGINSVYRSVC